MKRFDIETGYCPNTGQSIFEVEAKDGDYVLAKDVREAIEKAYMAGQADEGIDPSYSNAQQYADKEGL
jgi:hypothetical protein